MDRALQFQELPLAALTPGPWNTRVIDPDDPSLDELATSVQSKGVLEPIIVRKNPQDGTGYQIVAGERRWMAARRAGLETIPSTIREISDEEAMEICVIENLQRQDLSPLEQARGVEILLSRDGSSPEAVAVEIGRSPAWVAQRAAIAGGLTPEWKDAVSHSERPQALLTAAHLLLVARLPPNVQAEILDDDEIWLDYEWDPAKGRQRSRPRPPTVAELRKHVEHYQRNLSAAPWKQKDAELVPAAGPCSTCPKRSGAAPLLWTDDELVAIGAKDKKPKAAPDLCTDPDCWHEKMVAHIARKAEELKAEHGEVVLVYSGYGRAPSEYPKAKRHDAYKLEAQPAEGLVPCVVVNGVEAGHVFYGQTWASSEAGQKGKGKAAPAGPTPLKERRHQLLRRRQKLAVERLSVEIARAPIEALPKPDVVLRLVAVIGTDSKQGSIPSHGLETWPWRESNVSEAWKEIELGPFGSTTWKMFEAHTPETAAVDVWRQMLAVFAQRLTYAPHRSTERQWYEICRLAELVSVDPEPIWSAVVEEFPEPKAWAKLNEDGTPKAAAAGAKTQRARAKTKAKGSPTRKSKPAKGKAPKRKKATAKKAKSPRKAKPVRTRKGKPS